MANVSSVLKQLQQERARLTSQLETLPMLSRRPEPREAAGAECRQQAVQELLRLNALAGQK
jgi:hypothetical protein